MLLCFCLQCETETGKREKGVFLFCIARRGEPKGNALWLFFFCSCIKRSVEHTNTHVHLCLFFSSPPFSRLLLFEILWKKKKRTITFYFSVCRYIFYVYTTQQLRLARQTNYSRFKEKKTKKGRGKKDIVVKSQEVHSRNTTGKCTDCFLKADFFAFSFKELLTVPRKTAFHSQKAVFFFLYSKTLFFSFSATGVFVCVCVFFFFS